MTNYEIISLVVALAGVATPIVLHFLPGKDSSGKTETNATE